MNNEENSRQKSNPKSNQKQSDKNAVIESGAQSNVQLVAQSDTLPSDQPISQLTPQLALKLTPKLTPQLARHSTNINIVQITDCHLTADKSALFYGANPYQNLLRVLSDIHTKHISALRVKQTGIEANRETDGERGTEAEQAQRITAIIFTGDLVQDIEWQSYQNLLDAIHQFSWDIPFYAIAGNHDSPCYINKLRQIAPFKPNTQLEYLEHHWIITLLNSQDTNERGAGQVTATEWQTQKSAFLPLLNKQDNAKKLNILVVLHHHIQNFDSFIDKYPLKNKTELLGWFSQIPQIKHLVHGHVHTSRQGVVRVNRGKKKPHLIHWTACPASATQFSHIEDDITKLPPVKFGYNQIQLSSNGTCDIKTHWIKA